MEIEIRDITPEEAAPYGENADIVLTGEKRSCSPTPTAMSEGST